MVSVFVVSADGTVTEVANVLSGAELDEIAEKIVSRLTGSVISSAFPTWVGEYVRNSTGGHQWEASYWLPLMGSAGIQTRWVFESDGAIRLELANPSGANFWRGTFRPTDS